MDRVNELEQLIKIYKAKYYQGRPEISDHDYDLLEAELKKISPSNRVLEIVGTSIKSGKKIRHDIKMLSLAKTYDYDELIKWTDNKEVVSMFKIDGVSCSLIYEHSIISMAKTRGDGQYGEDIKDKVIWFKSIPQKILIKQDQVEVRGELYCTEEDFFKLSQEMVEIGLEKPASQRNIVAGLISRKDNLELCRYISFKAFDLIYHDTNFNTEIEKANILKINGFDLPNICLHKDSSKIKNAIAETEEFMAEGNYQVDGLVFSLNDLKWHEALGETAHHPRYKMAFKFRGESKAATINEILWSISRKGVLTPIAKIDPIELSGAKISRVTLHNFGLVRQFQLKRGDSIEVTRSGEVIPKFLNVIKSSEEKFIFPKRCPDCGSKVEIKEIRLMCSNPKCLARSRESILNFIQKIGIDDLSSKRLDQMMKSKLVSEIIDLYRLKKEDLVKIDKVKDRLATKILKSIEQSKKSDLTTFLSSLGINGGAYNKCDKIVGAGFDSIEKVKKLNVETLLKVESFAEKSASDFIASLKSKFSTVDKLLEVGFKFNVNRRVNSKLSSKKICITGALSEKRSKMEDIIKSQGGIMVSSISKKTDYLLTNEKESNSSKFKKAKSLNITIISEEELKKLIINK